MPETEKTECRCDSHATAPVSWPTSVIMILVFLFFTVPPVFAQEQPDSPNFSLRDRLEITFTGRVFAYDDLEETCTFSPLNRYIPSNNDPWKIDWQEKRFHTTLHWNLLDFGWFHLAPAVHLGMSQGEFSAANLQSGFSEWWQTETVPFWGGQLALEMYREKQKGLFLRLSYDHSLASGGEHEEKVFNSRVEHDPEARTASFTWRNEELLAAVGWRTDFLTPMAGISLTRFTLKKRLASNLTVPEIDPLLLEAINAEDGRFKYQNRENFSLLLSLNASITNQLELVATSRINSNLGWEVSLRYSF